jgi:acetyltransferase-like isoleucine patch superfamily enzyme
MKIGDDVRISPHAIFAQPDLVEMGDHVAIDPFTVVTTALTLGNYVHIAPHCTIIGSRNGKLIMGDFSALAAGCRIVCSSDDFKGGGLINSAVPERYRVVHYSTIRIERFVTLGTNSIVLPGLTIGEGAVTGAGSLVTKDLEPWGIFAGSPARKIGERPRDNILKYADEIMMARRSQS